MVDATTWKKRWLLLEERGVVAAEVARDPLDLEARDLLARIDAATSRYFESLTAAPRARVCADLAYNRPSCGAPTTRSAQISALTSPSASLPRWPI